jgi:hypothetical protein
LIKKLGVDMCGIFGGVSETQVDVDVVQKLSTLACQRGRDSSGLFWLDQDNYNVLRADFPVTKIWKKSRVVQSALILGHSRLITNGHSDNQPIERDGIFVIHNGIVLNSDKIWTEIGEVPKFEIDSEVIPALASYFLKQSRNLEDIPRLILEKCEGSISAILIFPSLGKISLFSNTGSMYVGINEDSKYFSSEEFPLVSIGCVDICQVSEPIFINIPAIHSVKESELRRPRSNFVPGLIDGKFKSQLLEYPEIELRRCTKCILPITMPYIRFDDSGICNYCNNYVNRNSPKPTEILEGILKQYRRTEGRDCIVPFSGGRDSTFGLHLAVKHFGLKPIAYTYDWGMVTDIGRRNISRMCAELGVENIVVAADIEWKRKNIKKNLQAWLKNPDLGMLSILTAGDKHFFRHIDTVRKQTGISLNLWSVNPLEVTHFKAGFLGVPPNFEEKNVYQSGLSKQIRYHNLRFKAMTKSPGYFNSSIFDTLSGEYFRSVSAKNDYYHLFDFWRWDENEIDRCLDSYQWERATDTSTSWRIGDGTAAFYNYVYHRVAGFSEHDTFRSNQIREGDITRDEALKLVEIENLPRYENINWYLEVLGMPFESVISRVNQIPRLMG